MIRRFELRPDARNEDLVDERPVTFLKRNYFADKPPSESALIDKAARNFTRDPGKQALTVSPLSSNDPRCPIFVHAPR